MKKIGIAFFVVLLIFSLSGCADQSTTTTSNQLTEIDSTLESLNEVVKSLEDVAIEDLTMPTL